MRTVIVALDLSRAFDIVNIGIIMKIILETTLPPKGRQTYVTFRNINSKYRRVKQGVPQGGVLYPTLFNLYMSRLPLSPEGIKLITFADNCALLSSITNIDEICSKLNSFLPVVHNCFVSNQLEISPEKSTATLFSTWTKEVKTQLDLVIGNQNIPKLTRSKILGVTIVNMLTFCAHGKSVQNKMQARTNILKSLAGSSWGKDKETLTITYIAIGRSISNYAALIWSPQQAVQLNVPPT